MTTTMKCSVCGHKIKQEQVGHIDKGGAIVCVFCDDAYCEAMANRA